MKNLSYLFFVLLIAISLNQGCNKKDDPVPTTQKVNDFIKEIMTDVYLWEQHIPDIDNRNEPDPKAYFKKLLYSEDKWSFITDNITEYENSLKGKEKSFGYSLAFGRFTNADGTPTGTYFGIVEYVYPKTPAANAGFTRGDIIVKLNGGNITMENYEKLLNSESISVTKGIYFGGSISITEVVSMSSRELNLNPVLIRKIIPYKGRKIGYLFYAQYIDDYIPSLDTVFQYFKDNQITDLVLDLRYNPGGYTSAAQHLCSSIAPLNVVNAQNTLVSYQWNAFYQDYWTKNNRQDQLRETFKSSVPVKLGLNKVYILTGRGSASASELTITGLQPYMDVVTIGETTYGKYTASITFKPEDIYKDNPAYYSDFSNWGIQPIVIRYANSQGVTNFVDGFAPVFPVDDELMPAFQLGELSEPLLKKAVELITGTTLTSIKSAEIPVHFKVEQRGFSKFDDFKRNLYLSVKSLE